MQIPAFNEEAYYSNRINNSSSVVVIPKSSPELFDSYVRLFQSDGYKIAEEYERGQNSFCALRGDSSSAYINYYGNLGEITVVTETNADYFDFSAPLLSKSLPPQITQIHLEDFGMSYAIRISDGRFIIIDGGREFTPDANRLFECLKSTSPHEKPIIAAWIMTHPHSDHFHCFLEFFDLYSDEVVFERFMYTFPEHDDVAHYPSVTAKNSRFEDSSIFTNVPRMKERIAKTEAKTYSPHTGQHYNIGDASIDVLASIDDTIHRSPNINATSLVLRMELGGQVILWGADATFSEISLPEKYGDFLKSDILQIPHHGFQSGTAEAEIKGYKIIAPSVCLLPVSDFNAFTVMGTYREATRFLMTDAGVDEIISGDLTRTLTLPYKADSEAKNVLRRKYLRGRANAGSTTWVFTNLSTANEEDFEFTLLNMTSYAAKVEIELFFENSSYDLRYIETEAPRISIKTLSIIGSEVDGDARYFNWMSLKELGVPENESFAVRFIADKPIVVSHKNHAPAYVSPISE